MSAFSRMVDSLFANPNFGKSARYTAPGGGAATSCVVCFPDRADRELGAVEGRPFTAGNTLDVRASELTPARRGVFQIMAADGVTVTETLTVLDDPRRLDSDRLLWTCTVR